MTVHRSIRPLITLFGAVALVSPFYFKIERLPSSSPAVENRAPRRLDVAVDDSDEFVRAVLSVVAKPDAPVVSAADHERITSILGDARELMGQAKELIKREDPKAHEVVDLATAKFREAKEHIRRQRVMVTEESSNLRATDTQTEEAQDVASDEDADLGLDLSRSVYETYITFPECIEKLFAQCLKIVNADLQNLGLSTVELIVHEKRNINQDGYNKVVIITNKEADLVSGRAGDGIVTYPFTWDDSVLGTRTLGVDGKWNCQGITPEECCSNVKASAPNPDTKGSELECHIFVPFGGVGNPRRNDRVYINLSPDGRVHEAPVIQ